MTTDRQTACLLLRAVVEGDVIAGLFAMLNEMDLLWVKMWEGRG